MDTAPPRLAALAAALVLAACAAEEPGEEAEAVETTRVEHVVDGDTVVVAGDRTVRLIGIDTPERGACGHDEARAALSDLVEDTAVELVEAPPQTVDRYDRLLRYVEVAGEDVGRELIRSGWAIARYDSRTGQPHPREDAYRDDDATSRDRGCYRARS